MQSDENRMILQYLDVNKQEKARILYEASKFALHKQLVNLIESSMKDLQVNSIEDVEALVRLDKLLKENQ